MDFLFVFPLWLVAGHKSKISGFRTIHREENKAIAIYTDEDLAQRDLDTCPEQMRDRFFLREIDDPLAMYGLLVLLKNHGYTHVLIDPAAGKKSAVYTIEWAIEATGHWFS